MQRAERIRVGLVFGGRSAEHEISIRSARSVAEAMDRDRFEPALIAIDRAGAWHLHDEASFARLKGDAAEGAASQVLPAATRQGFALLDPLSARPALPALGVMFPVLHGPYGEDGTLQGFLELCGVPYVGSGVLGSSVGMDKDVQKRLLRDAGLPVVPFEVILSHVWNANEKESVSRAMSLGLPVFVKPANLGSSIGISKVSGLDGLAPAIRLALAYDNKIVVEKGINAREVECAVLGNEEPRASVPGEIVPGEEFYSYDDKYKGDSKSQLLIPAPLSPSLTEAVRSLAVRAFAATECSGMARVDFLLDRTNEKLYVNELNTIPGFTSISMYPKLWKATGLSFRDLISALIDLAIARSQQRHQLRITPD